MVVSNSQANMTFAGAVNISHVLWKQQDPPEMSL